MVIAVILIGIASGLPWWSFEVDATVVQYLPITQGVELGPFIATEWEYRVFPGTVLRRATAWPFWDFAESHPGYGHYTNVALFMSTLLVSSLGLSIFALISRRRPRTRMKGWPTVAEALALVLLLAVMAITAAGLPIAAGFDSFLGSMGRLKWGPSFGWYVAAVAASFIVLSTLIGWRIDRGLRGFCWDCRREVSGDVCGRCGSVQ